MRYCSYCGKEINEDMSFCPFCGKPVTDINNNGSTEELSANTAAQDENTNTKNISENHGLDKICTIASYACIGFIFISLFLPYISVEIFGSKTAKRLIEGDGIFFVILLLIILVSLILKKNKITYIFTFILCLLTIFEVNFFSRQIMNLNTSEDNIFNIDYSALLQKGSGYYLLILGVIFHTIAILVNAILKKNKATTILMVTGIVIIALISGIITFFHTPGVKYTVAGILFNCGNYELSAILYNSIGNYENSADCAKVATYAYHNKCGKKLMSDGKYDEAIEELEKAEGYDDSASVIMNCYYEKGIAAYNNEDLDTALESLKKAGDGDEVIKARIDLGKALIEKEEYAKAVDTLEKIKLDDEARKILAYSRAMNSDKTGRYQEAIEYFTQAKDVYDAKDRIIEENYKCGTHLMNQNKYAQAKTYFDKIPDYNDAKALSDACNILEAKNYIDEGRLNTAKEKLDTLPDQAFYKNVKVSDLKKIISDNEKWLKICGKWSSTGGTIKTRQEGSYGYFHEWHLDVDENAYGIEIRCIPQDNGTVSVKCNSEILVFTNYSSIKEYLDGDTITVTGSAEMSEPSSLNAGDYTTITISDSVIKLSYKKKEDNYIGFDDIYTTDITYGTRTTAY